ncbi:hypothetical protein COU19_00995 [Candidatus Kaiserbacteria bacterium CG10_big_fil_rev_8_21_14_0_10_56_12]|uniref:L-threonylcarbamoyladenylate synthase n=1 Tax=Candidatus Kaiserbacteria bacterium CG10_big_fil_rev_8_21_14_0_10_56_12 TaxID=1974611 RepID=A0A2H0UC01_9BACT|nr:MAG: hypothetical protein COU19_00995 [Candidatus Kaiserbacteria bacterium CG10_big_fil_rev_8_21_14_0_10_56_12]
MSTSVLLRGGAVGVLATDTLYGLVASALHEGAVTHVYRLKRRSPKKPCIILIASLDDLATFGIELSPAMREALTRYWPGPTSIVLPCGP